MTSCFFEWNIVCQELHLLRLHSAPHPLVGRLKLRLLLALGIGHLHHIEDTTFNAFAPLFSRPDLNTQMSPLPSDTGLGSPLGNLLSKVACERVHAPFSPGAVWGNLRSDLPIVQLILIYLCLKSFFPSHTYHLHFESLVRRCQWIPCYRYIKDDKDDKDVTVNHSQLVRVYASAKRLSLSV